MTLPVIVIGAGGHAKVVVDALLACELPVKGLVDADPALAGGAVLGAPIIGSDEAVLSHAADRVLLSCGIGSVGVPTARRRLFEAFVSKGYRFVSLVHPSAVVGRDVEIGEGAQVMAGAVVQPGSRIGRNAIINTRSSIDHDCLIGDHVHVAPGVTLSGGVSVGEGSHIGTGASVIQGITIGRGCVIGAGALVIRDVADAETVVGVPAKVVSR